MPVLKNPRHERFAQAVAQGKSADEAYAAAGYKPHRSNASRMSANDSIRARVAELVAKGANQAQITVTRTLQELSRVGLSDIRRAFDEEGNLKPVSDWDEDLAAAVASVEVVTRSLPGEADEELDGQLHGGALKRNRNAKVEYIHKIRFWDKNSALEKIAKHLGMFVERQEVTGKNGAPIEERVEVIHNLDRDWQGDTVQRGSPLWHAGFGCTAACANSGHSGALRLWRCMTGSKFRLPSTARRMLGRSVQEKGQCKR